MTKTTTVILFGGLPASGKSTLARNIQEYYYMLNNNNNNTNKKVIHLEYDALEDEIVSKQQQQDEGEDRILAWNQARYVAVQNLERIIAKHQKDDDIDNNDNHDETSLVILLDDNFHLRGMRKQIHRKLLNIKNRHDTNIRFGIIWMDTDLEMCLERNSNRQQQQPPPQQRRNIEKHVIQKMNRVMEVPTNYWEGYWIYGNQVTFSNLIDFIENCDDIQDVKEEEDDDHDLEQQERDRKKTLDNLRHSCDKLLRSWVGKVAKYDKSLASSANIARKELLVLLKDDNDSSSTEEQLLTSFLDLIGKSHAETKDDKLRALLLTNHKTNIEKH